MTTKPPLGERIQAFAARVTARPQFWAAAILLLASYPVIHSLSHPLPEPLPVLSDTLSPFELIDHKGQPLGTRELVGRLWVATVVCASCPQVDPDYPERVFEIQHRSRGVGKRFTLVSITTDPERDTPEAIADYAARFRVSKKMWKFASGPPDEVESVLTQLFDPPAVRRRVPGTELASRYQSAALIDTDMRIRGYYDIRDDESLDRLLVDMGLVINRGY